MRTPSWVELVGRNTAAEATCLIGTLEVIASPSDRARFDFHHAPGGKWRIEHGGHPVYVATGRTAVIRIGDQMQQVEGDIRLPTLGAQFSPLDLLGSESLLQNMSVVVKPADSARPVEVAGRASWSLQLLTPRDEPLVLTFDDATGVLVRVESPDEGALLQVDNLVEPPSLPDSLFVWDGPVEQPGANPRGGREHDDIDDQRLEFVHALVAAHARRHKVLDAIADADSESSARASLVRLLGVTEFGADSIMSTPLGHFRGDQAEGLRRTLATMERQRRHR